MHNSLEVDSIRKSFGDKQVLTDIYLKCQTGDIIGLLGRNGSGKTTLLKIIFGTLHTDHKHIRINGELIDIPFTGKGLISYLPQDNFLPRDLTVNKVIDIYEDQIKVKEFINDLILSKVLKTKIRHLSGGESRYLEIKLILCQDSQIILLDEPFNGISPIHTDIIKGLIREQSSKKGIILTDHDYRNVFDVANKYMVLFDGGIKPLKTKDEFKYWGYLPDK
jgi:ABC-type multidrug transport system ATPase subunit